LDERSKEVIRSEQAFAQPVGRGAVPGAYRRIRVCGDLPPVDPRRTDEEGGKPMNLFKQLFKVAAPFAILALAFAGSYHP
jgi:hypothetical protein